MSIKQLLKLKATACRVPSSMSLREVGIWIYDPNADPDVVHGLDIDMAVVGLSIDGTDEGIVTPEEMSRMKYGSDGSRRLILCELALACPSTWRPYWKWGEDDWPTWVIGMHDGNYVVNIMSPHWHEILRGEVEAIKRAGFDGVWLDCRYAVPIDTEMADLVMKVRKWLGDGTLVVTNGEHLIQLPDFEKHVDGFGKVKLFSADTPDPETIDFLEMASKPVFVVERCPHDEDEIAKYRRLVSEHGWNPCLVTDAGYA